MKFSELFDGRQDAYGSGAEGKCVRGKPNYAMHLGGAVPIGIYPMVPGKATISAAFNPDAPLDWRVRWGCVDFDIKTPSHEKYDYETEAEADIAATNLIRVLDALGIVGWSERTRSHGRHVWVFASEWVPAGMMRNALLVATEIAGVSQREVNPKSDGSNLEEGQLGNYVRLPYPKGAQDTQTIRGYAKAHEFVQAASQALVPLATLAKVAGLYREPLPTVDWHSPADLNGDVPKVVKHVIENGPHDGDRSNGLVYIAHECRKADLTPQQTLEVLMVADDAWGKYTGRRDREQRLQEIVERAWK